MSHSTVPGFFSDDSMIRRVNREGVVLIGGGRALLMQIAHPLVAAGVADHSAFPARGQERLLRTLRLMFAIIFGSERQATDAIEQINAVHEHVYGDGYAATDPELLLWVHAVFIDTTLLVYRRFVGPLSDDDAAAYYEEAKKVARLLGVPEEAMPPDMQAFASYMAGAVAAMRVSPDGRRLAREVLANAPGGLPSRWLMRLVTVDLLPPHLRDEFGFVNGPTSKRLVRLLAGSSRCVVPRIPPALRRPPWFLMPPAELTDGQTRRWADDMAQRSS